MENNQNELDVIALTESEINDCLSIAESANGAKGADFTRDGFIRTGSDKLVELVGTKPDWVFLKQVQAQTIQFMINEPFNFASDTADVYFSYILKDAIGRHSFVKPSKDTVDSKRMSDKRENVKKEYEHISLENVTKSLLEINQKMAQDILNNKQPKKEDKALSSELKMAQDIKLGKVATLQKEQQKSNIDKLRKEIESMLKIDSGRLNKNNEPIFEWSVVKLDFVYRCLQNEDKVKKVLS
jgi:type II secretory pathway component PulL